MPNSFHLLHNLAQIADLLRRLACETSENDMSLRFTGKAGTDELYDLLLRAQDILQLLGSPPQVHVGEASDTPLGDEGFDTTKRYFHGKEWSFRIIKNNLLNNSDTPIGFATYFVFFFKDFFQDWSCQLDPLSERMDGFPSLSASQKTIFYVRNISAPFGSAKLYVVPWFHDLQGLLPLNMGLPDVTEVQETIHVIGSRTLQISPQFFGLTWGDCQQAEAQGFLRASIISLAVSLTQELREQAGQHLPVLRGLRKITPVLLNENDQPNIKLNDLLKQVVIWVYSERKETRHKLIIDRLTIEWCDGESFLQCLNIHLKSAWEQAKDSYGFIILDRKDAHQKELRDFMKDMRAQADLYAKKVRDLLAGLSRDSLAVLLLIGLFLARIGPDTIANIMQQKLGIVFMRILAGYILLSGIIQAILHSRDVALADKESKNWLSLLRNYTASKDIEDKYSVPITSRKKVFYWFLLFFCIFYLAFAILLFCLPCFFAPPSPA